MLRLTTRTSLEEKGEIVESSKDQFHQAAQMQRAGELDEAARILARILEREPSNAAALHLLAVIHNERGEIEHGVELLKQALAARPSIAAYHVALAEAYRRLGDLGRAEGCCRIALKLNGDFPEALGALGLVLQATDRPLEAINHFRRAVELRPDLAPAHRDLGMALREQGQHENAVVHLRRAVELAPDQAGMHTCLGLALLDSNLPEEALTHNRTAVNLQPNVAIFHHNLGNALRRLERWSEARAAYLEALRLDPELSRTHLQIGMTLRIQGELDQALPWYEQAVDLASHDPLFWEQLAELHGERQDHLEAIRCWERAIELSPVEKAHSYLSLGWSLQEEGRLAEAADSYRAAARVQPDLAQAYVNLGGIHEELGRMAEAESAYRTGIRLQPHAGVAHAKLGTLLRGELPEADFLALEERLADPDLNPSPRARLLFAASVVHDATGNYSRAAAYSRQANALNLEISRGRREYQPALHERYVDDLIRECGASFLERTRNAGLETRRPIFVFGLPRSGTTLIEQILSSHSQIHGAGELRLARLSFEAVPLVVDRPGSPQAAFALLDSQGVRKLAERHLDRLQACDEQAERIVDKMPDNYLYLGLLATMFPNAVFIHCRRDLRDIAVSCWITDFRYDNIPWASDPDQMGSRFRQYVRLMDHWRTALPVEIHDVQYEQVVNDLEGVSRRLLSACGLKWEPACLEFHRTQRRVRTASIGQVRKPLYDRSVARWKNYEYDLADLFDALPLERAKTA